MDTPELLEQILDLARWAPSGDNSQPWRFEVVAPLHVVVHGVDKRDFYDVDGHSLQISIGAMLETLNIAASHFGFDADMIRRTDSSEFSPQFDIYLSKRPAIASEALAGCIERRSVQRLPFTTRPLGDAALQALQASVGAGYSVVWRSTLVDRLRAASLLFYSAKIRMVSPDAYVVHKGMIKWDRQFSEEGIPDQALGAPAFLLPSMKFLMTDWRRIRFANRFLAGTWFPRLAMDFLPAVACAGHFAIVASREPLTIDERIDAGRRMQRFWLTVTHLGLQMQPAITPLVFSRYVRHGLVFPEGSALKRLAHGVYRRLQALWSTDEAARIVFMGRVGYGAGPKARSIRLPLQALWMRSARGESGESGSEPAQPV